MSLPDTSMLPDIARILEISTDYLLGISRQSVVGEDDGEIQHIIGENLRKSLEALELIIGEKLIPLFMGDEFVEEIKELRFALSQEGYLLPVIRIRDELKLDENEFMILSFQNILYSEQHVCVDENTLHYMIERIGDCVREKYFEILTPDLLKGMIDNLKIKYPVLIDGVIPDKISYNLLTDMVKRILRRGGSIAFLPKIIEVMDSVMGWQQDVPVKELEDEIIKEIKKRREFLVCVEREESLI